jgi:hypothetical protein
MMETSEILECAHAMGISLTIERGYIAARPKGRTSPELVAAIRAHKGELLALLTGASDPELTNAVTVIEQAFPGARLVEVRESPTKLASASQVDLRASWPRSVAPDSRRPLIPPEVRAKIEAIERDARGMGWPPEILWSANFWDLPRGLAAVLDAEDEIAEVTREFIIILKTKRDLLGFRRYSA